MHGRVKVKTTAEQQAAKEKERKKKSDLYIAGQQKAMQKRQNGELDNEAFEITCHLLLANPDIYTTWNFRREILLFFGEQKDDVEMRTVMEGELQFTETCLRSNPKSYGSWHHRRWVMLHMPNADWNRELGLCTKYLELDERNFHCWDYRRFVVKNANMCLEKELDFTDKKIAANFSNYSSWHYRSKLLPLVFPDKDFGRPICEEKLLHVQNAVFTDPNDQSAWFYHRWLLGTGEKLLRINIVNINRNGHVIVVFSKAIQVSDGDVPVTVKVGDHVLKVNWFLPSSDAASCVLVGKITETTSCNLLKEADAKVFISYNTKDSECESLSVNVSDESKEGWTCRSGWNKEFSTELSAATSSVLQQQIESCIQLLELEPNCKWPVMTCILLMRSLDLDKYYEQIMEYFKLLISIDLYRKRYYEDLRSKFILEHCIEDLNLDVSQLSLAGKSLSSLYHIECFVLIKVLDLSFNCLTNLTGIGCLVNLEKLIVDDNRLKKIDRDIEKLPGLKHFSARNNLISDEDLSGLPKSESITVLILQGNPMCQAKNYETCIKLLFPNLRSLDLVDVHS